MPGLRVIWLRAIAWFWSCIAIFAGVRSVTFDGNAPAVHLQPTALDEAYLRLVDQRRVVWQNRGQFWGGGADDAAHPRRSRAGAEDGQAVQWVRHGRRCGESDAARM